MHRPTLALVLSIFACVSSRQALRPCAETIIVPFVTPEGVADSITLFHRDSGYPDSTKTIREAVQKHKLSALQHIQLLKYAISHAMSHSCPHVDSDMYLVLNDRADSVNLHSSISSLVDLGLLANMMYPLRIWTTNTQPVYRVMLYGHDEFMSREVMSKDDSILYDQIRISNRFYSDISNKFPSGSWPPGPSVLVDVGANLGMVSLYAASLGNEVVSIEANDELSNMLFSSCKLNQWTCERLDIEQFNQTFLGDIHPSQSQMHIVTAAATNASGLSVQLMAGEKAEGVMNSGGTSMYGKSSSSETETFTRNKKEDASFDFSRENVPTVSLDDLLFRLDLLPAESAVNTDFLPRQKISLLKLDCEGCEPLALLGATRMFEYNAPLSILTEISHESLEAAGWTPLAYLQLIESKGYDIYDMQHKIKVSPIKADTIEAKIREFDNGAFDYLCYHKKYMTMLM